MNKVMFEVMRYFGLNHRPSSGVKLKLIKLRVTFTLESQIIPNMKWIDVRNKVKHREDSREISD